jgi:hypothetical protein
LCCPWMLGWPGKEALGITLPDKLLALADEIAE